MLRLLPQLIASLSNEPFAPDVRGRRQSLLTVHWVSYSSFSRSKEYLEHLSLLPSLCEIVDENFIRRQSIAPKRRLRLVELGLVNDAMGGLMPNTRGSYGRSRGRAV